MTGVENQTMLRVLIVDRHPHRARGAAGAFTRQGASVRILLDKRWDEPSANNGETGKIFDLAFVHIHNCDDLEEQKAKGVVVGKIIRFSGGNPQDSSRDDLWFACRPLQGKADALTDTEALEILNWLKELEDYMPAPLMRGDSSVWGALLAMVCQALLVSSNSEAEVVRKTLEQMGWSEGFRQGSPVYDEQEFLRLWKVTELESLIGPPPKHFTQIWQEIKALADADGRLEASGVVKALGLVRAGLESPE